MTTKTSGSLATRVARTLRRVGASLAVLALSAGWAGSAALTSPAAASGSPTITIGDPVGAIVVGQSASFGVTLSNFVSTDIQATVEFVDGGGAPVTNGTLAIDATGLTLTSVTGYSSPSGAKVGFGGAFADVSAALATLTWTPNTEQSNSLKISVSTKPGTNEFYSSATGHYYQYISTAKTWDQAQSYAQGLTLNGLSGYLAHITSYAENEFVKNGTTATNIWIGSTDDANEGQWRWAGLEGTGDAIAEDVPKISGRASAFYLDTGSSDVADGYDWGYDDAVAGGWANGEPNDWGGSGEDCAVTNWGENNGRWNDLPCTYTTGFLVEFGGREDPALSTAESVSAQQIYAAVSTRPGAPTISSIATDNQQLKVSFAAPGYTGTSSITNYKYSTDGTNYVALSPASTTSPFIITALSSDGTTPLTNGTSYSITLKAVNSSGDSPASNSVSATPAEPPAPAPSPAPTPAPVPTVEPPTPSPTPAPPAVPEPAPPAPAPLPEPAPVEPPVVPEPTPPPVIEEPPLEEPQPAPSVSLAAIFTNPVAILTVAQQVGEPVANSAIGASGDDSVIVEFDPTGSPEAVKATNNLVGATAAVAGVAAAAGAAGAAAAAAGAAGAAGSAGAAASSASAAGSAGSALAGGGTGAGGGGGSTAGGGAEMNEDVLDALAGADFDIDRFKDVQPRWGDRLPWWRWRVASFWDAPSTWLSAVIAPISPLVSKLINDGSYLRAIFGPLSLVLPALGAWLALESLTLNDGLLLHPPVALYLWLVILGIFDAFAGSLAMTIFVLGSLPLMDFSSVADWRMLAGIVVSGFGPIVLARSIRDFRRRAPISRDDWLIRAGDIAFASLMGGWVAGLIIRALPALTGLTLPAANYVLTFQVYATIAIAARIMVEDVAARFFPSRMDLLTPDVIPGPPVAQILSAQVLRFVFYVFIASAFMGFGPVVWGAALLFMVPNILGFFSDKLPNFRVLWRFLPTGLAGLAMILGLEIVLENSLGAFLGDHPDFSIIFVFCLLGLIIVMSTLAMMGREGGPREEHWTESKRFALGRRLGAVLVFVLLLQFTSML